MPTKATNGAPKTGLEKRKACDLCHLKRIRCDARKPSCSHCELYQGDCIYTPHIKSRRNKLKASLQTKNLQESSQPAETRGVGLSAGISGQMNASHTRLPPLNEISVIVDDLFANFNCPVPLFSESRFKRMLDEYESGYYDPSIEACIAVCVAIALEMHATQATLPDGFTSSTMKQLAQAHMTSLATRVQDLRGLQVVLGLTLLLQGSSEQEASLVLISTAVQLSNRLRLHEDLNMYHQDPEESSERNNVFRITYILDKEISNKFQVPYLVQDMDTTSSSCSAMGKEGWITSHSGAFFNIFAARFHLARIQGRIYDRLLSARDRDKPREDKQADIDHLIHVLHSWSQSIPETFRPEAIVSQMAECASRQWLILQFSYLHCLFMIHGVWSHNQDWTRRIVQYGQGRLQWMVPQGWAQIVAASRRGMRLFNSIRPNDEGLLWTVSCTYFSALLIILVHQLTLPAHQDGAEMAVDQDLIHRALNHLQCRSKLPGLAFLQELCEVLTHLHQSAEASILQWSEPGTNTYNQDQLPAFNKLISIFSQSTLKPRRVLQ